LALDALTNYLGLQERGQWVPEGLARMLQAKILEPVEDAGARQVRRAAVAAYGAIREVGVFADLIALLDDDDPEVARLAKACTRTMYGWLRMPSRAPPRIDRSVMEAWAIAIARQAERYSSRTFGLRESKFSATRLGTWPWSREIAWCLACWEQDPLDPTAPARRLGLPEDLRAELELQHAALADFVDSPGVNVESSEDDADMSTDRFLYRQATGRAVALHDSEVWRDPRPEAQGSAHGPGDAAPTGRVDFTCESGGEPLVEPAGTIEAVFWEAARHVPGDALSDGTRLPPYLRFAHPGKSRLTIRSVIPDEAIALEVAIRHHIGTRDNLRDRGSVTLRLSVSGTSTRSVFPGPRPYSWPVGIDPGEPESIVHLQFDDLSARRSLELVLEELHGNTTHRIDRIDLRWRLN
ncbi:MAG: hypothetical protein KDA28_03085, partial [Phycisphaerales bacterium]|nr:hypothetical protein [Phycisphaerales bacterium]